MKKLSILFISLFILTSCGDKAPTVDELIATGDTQVIAQKKTELLNQKKELENEIKAIENYLDKNSVQKDGALVSISTVQDTMFNHFIELQGSVDTKQNITLMPETAGILTNVYVKEGQRVSKGQRLAKIDDGGMSQSIEQMKVQAQLAKTTFERQERLWNQKIGSEIQYLQAKANYEAQENAIKSMQQQLAKTIITAPFSGVIDDVITEQGNTVSPGMTQILRIVNLNNMYIEVEVPETYISSVNEGTNVKVEFPVLGKTVESNVRQTSSFINPANRSFRIEIPVENKEGAIKPNLTARLKINDYTNKEAILIPLAVISENQNGDQYVMIASDLKSGDQFDTAVAKRRVIQTGKTSENMIEITDGLEKGDRIIVEGARSVKEDQQIRIKKA
ncbi:RND family efflux transporter MFP subunit [Nonlabens dokdonensis]|uniref:Membrane fusion efflux transporter, RND family n=2 Tax=Nonlabens dokdonensis TaxID=328515 RepID=L7W9L1_NONDD|nr:efflux RND transporter periplasmic adaptor subunit [Nonlabens dokdonensis]AGC76912.1 membrane fusion efflux transporter, RND family [Nonlabens dokdonensis DSW-6]PZX36818.1 RND family efflux transporter MFP subunit [Nonlabens dokdonensis]